MNFINYKPKSIGIIGYGDFGKLIEQVAKKYFTGIEIKISSRSNEIDNKKFFALEEVCKSDLLFPCIPISSFEETTEQIIELVSSQTVIFEVCTVKYHPAQVLKKYSDKVKYICTHPMFGPYSYAKLGNNIEGLRIVLSDNNLNNAEYIQIKDILEYLKLKIIELSADEHDKKIAKILFLTHLMAQVISKAGFDRTEIDTVSFGFLMDAVESVRNDTKLFHDVYKYNPYCKEVLEEIDQSYQKVISELQQK